MSNFLLEIYAGLATAVLIWLWGVAAKRVNTIILRRPGGEDQISVQGKWHNSLKSKLERSEVTMDLYQKGTEITGTMLIDVEMYKREGTIKRSFECSITGQNRYGYIILQGVPSGKNLHAFNCGIFVVKQGGEILEGSAIRVHNVDSSIFIDTTIIWEKRS